MYHKIEDFLIDLAYESEASLKVFKVMTDESLKRKVSDKGRSLGFLAWHIIETQGEMMNKTGLSVYFPKKEDVDITKAENLVAEYKKASDSLAEQIKSKWKDETLHEEDDMYGSKWKKGITLGAFLSHEIHHRGQMTVLMRQAGLKVPGVYGPAAEEWASMGMEAPE
jgi:uncharacterized damage-inducible protein DinB